MSLNTGTAEDDIENLQALSPSCEDFDEIFDKCQRKCVVRLIKLSDEEILQYGGIPPSYESDISEDRKGRAKTNIRDVQKVDFRLFDHYKKSRQNYIKRKNRNQASTEIEDYGFSTEEDDPLPSDDYAWGVSSSKKKRKKVSYEEDDDWNPNSDGEMYSTRRPKKALRSLRVNTRRKRIESNSSGSSEDDFEDLQSSEKVHSAVETSQNGNSSCDIKGDLVSEPQQKTSILDNEVLNKIMKEMEDFHNSKGLKLSKSSTEVGKKSDCDFVDLKPNRKRRLSRVLKITDNLTPTIVDVRQTLEDMLKKVCDQRKHSPEKSRRRPCKWCDSPFVPGNKGDELCKICRDVVRESSTPAKTKPKPKNPTPKLSTKTNLKSKIFKSLPKCEQQRLRYSDSTSTKNCTNLQDVPAKFLSSVDVEVHAPPPSKSINVTNIAAKKTLMNNNGSTSKTKIIKTKKKSAKDVFLPNVIANPPSGVKTITEDNKSKTNLLRINFPGTDVDVSSEIKAKQDTSSEVEYGTYLLPPVPTVVVANYAATDAKSGDYYLSSVYYQNEMTQSEIHGSQKENVSLNMKTNVLPSMPSIDQLAFSMLNQLPNTSSLSLTPLDKVCSNTTGITAAINSKCLVNQLQVSEKNIISLSADDLRLLLNPNLQIAPLAPATNVAPDIASLFSNEHLQIQPIGSAQDILLNSINVNSQDEEIDNDSSVSGVENNNSEDVPPTETDSLKTLSSESSAVVNTGTSEPVKECRETKLNVKDNPPEEKMSSKDLFKKMSLELDAIAILGVVDFDRNPRASLERISKNSKNQLDTLQTFEPKTEQVQRQLKIAENNCKVFELAKTYLKTFGSFEKMSNTYLRHAKLQEQIQIKKEKFLDEEEEQSSCQFGKIQPIPTFDFQQGLSLDQIPNIETEINPLPLADPSQFGTVHHFSTPASIPRSESRETPSRGSGPLTPSRPESAMSQLEEPALTPAQIKKERMEAETALPVSQGTFVTPPAVGASSVLAGHLSYSPQQQVSQQQMPMNPIQTQQVMQQQIPMSRMSTQQAVNALQQQNVSQSSQPVLQMMNDMTSRLQANRQPQQQIVTNSHLRNAILNPQLLNHPQLIAPRTSNQQGQSNSMMHYQTPQQQQAIPSPNVTVQPKPQVIMNFNTRPQQQQNLNHNYYLKNGQILNIQQQNPQQQHILNIQQQNPQQQQHVLNIQQQNTHHNIPNTNIMVKNTQMVNVQQVYLPSGQPPRYQPTQQSLNLNLVQQGQMGQQLSSLVNSAGQSGGYSFQGQQLVGPTQQMASVQQNQVMQSPSNQAFVMQNNRVLFFEIQQQR